MSLSYWIRDYVYIPLGGSRKGTARKCLNLLIAMTLCGIWHGLSVHYLLWGLFHGMLMAAENLINHFDLKPLQILPANVHKPVQVMSTFLLVTFGWLLFKYSVPDFITYMNGMVPW